jgi:hypothetical protein
MEPSHTIQWVLMVVWIFIISIIWICVDWNTFAQFIFFSIFWFQENGEKNARNLTCFVKIEKLKVIFREKKIRKNPLLNKSTL